MEDRFRKLEDEYFRLKGQLAAGRITQDQFQKALSDLMIQDAQGRYWMLGLDSAKWNYHDGAKWVEADPYTMAAPSAPIRPPELPPSANAPSSAVPQSAAAPPARAVPPAAPVQYAAPPAPRSGMGCGGCLLRGCLVLIVLLILAAAAGFVAYRSGAITPQSVLTLYLNITGQGPADIEVDNFRDDAIHITIKQTSAAQDSGSVQGSLDLNAFDVKSFHAPGPGKYAVSFGAANSNEAALGVCTLTLRGGDRYQFVALPDKIVVNNVNRPASQGADFVVGLSNLCR